MLGLCWTPATTQGMQKMASTMPSNLDQLLGAILVRKDIFHRFETTMHDTCLDANNLLEYLFSLYNSTAAPRERENLPSPQSLAFIHRDTDYKKGMGRGQHVFPNPSAGGNPQLLQPNIYNRSSDPRIHISGAVDGQRKKIKVEQQMFETGLNSTVHEFKNYTQPAGVKPSDNRSVFSSVSNHQISNIKVEVTSGVESQHAQSSSCLPPFSQICRQGSRPYSPALTQYSDSLIIPSHNDEQQNLSQDPGVNDVKIESEQGLPVASLSQNQQAHDIQNSPKYMKKHRLKGYSTDGCNRVERISRKKKHPCFCGALFTRADNLKRHIRKCHEEKLLGPNLDVRVNTSVGPVTENFSLVFPSSSQDCIKLSQAQNSQQQTTQQYLQQEDSHSLLAGSAVKSTQAVKWSCFCGDSFDHHRQLVEHTRTHDSNT
ncbi:hypothetical protein BsWGS_07835 [Bradybaena similaris]